MTVTIMKKQKNFKTEVEMFKTWVGIFQVGIFLIPFNRHLPSHIRLFILIMYILFFRKNQKNVSQKEVRDLTFDFIVEF